MYLLQLKLVGAIAQEVKYCLPFAKPRVHSQMISCEIRGGPSVTGAGISPSSFAHSVLAIVPLLLQARLSQPPEVCNRIDQAAHYHILSISFLGSCLTRHLSGYRVRNLLF
jgi:hypothetical protein